jgi:quercetin dioxygenase-like cupin family protein
MALRRPDNVLRKIASSGLGCQSLTREVAVLKVLQVVSSALLIFASPLTLAAEPALAFTFKDTQLKWGSCPDFIPKGCEIAVLHGDPAKENADVFFKVPANFTIPNHWHTSAERMVLVSGELHVTYEGQPTATLKSGSYAYGPAKVPHKAVCGNGAPCVLFIAFEAPVDAIPAESAAK